MGDRRRLVWLAALALACGAAEPPPAEPRASSTEPVRPGRERSGLSGRAEVLDGDSLRLRRERVALFGIDAPEPGQSCRSPEGVAFDCGERARRFLAEQVHDARVRCVRVDTDADGGTVARCGVGGDDLGAALVRNGWALAHRRHASDYVRDEDEARSAARGLWAGEFDPPREWRAASRKAVASSGGRLREPPGECRIKGDISRSGRIYHRPGSPSYPDTSIDESRGERWFCSEDEALAAGWRPLR